MDMARAILERVQEVELEITPEFRKPTHGGKSDLKDLETALLWFGWKESKDKSWTAPPGVHTMVWTHPNLADVTIGVAYDWKKNVLIDKKISVVAPGLTTEYSATPETVKKLTKAWLSGAAKGGAAPVEAEEWPAPKRHSWNMTPRVDYEWEDEVTVRGVTAAAHPGSVYAISWSKSSHGLGGNWGAAIRAIKKLGKWGKVYVYGVHSGARGAQNEFAGLIDEGVVKDAFVAGETGMGEYDANVEDMLKEYVGGHQPTEET